MRRVLQALEQRAITATKVEVDWLISEASNSIQAYIEDSANLTQLKRSIDQLKQASSTLQIMQIHGGVLLVDEVVKVIQNLIDGKAERVEEAQDVVSRSIIRLSEYLSHVEAGYKDVPLVLMPLLNDLRASRDEALLSENVLFFPNVDGVIPPQAVMQSSESADSAWLRVIRTNFQKTLLACVSGGDVPTAAAQICKLSIRLQRTSESDVCQKLWWLGSALAQSVAIGALPFNASIASLFNSLDKQIKLLIELGEADFSKRIDENIIKNILYYVAISDNRGRIVNQVKEAYKLNEQIPQQNDMAEIRKQISAPSSEVLITVSKALLEDVASAKDCIELFIHSSLEDQSYVDRLYLGLQRVSDTLSMIGIEEYKSKAEHQIREVELLKSGEQADAEIVLLGVSEVILEIETCINNFIEYRINFQETSDDYQAENARFVDNKYDNEHKAAFSVTVSEVLLRIEQTKEMLTDIIHIAFDEDKTNHCAQNIREIRGVISVIDLTSPLELIDGIGEYISSDRFKQDVNEHGETLKDLADCIVGLQCYFEQLESRVPYADQILEHCELALARISTAIPIEQAEDSQSEDSGEPTDEGDIDVDLGATMIAMKGDLNLEVELPIDNSMLELPEMDDVGVNALPDLNAFVDELAQPNDNNVNEIIVDGQADGIVADVITESDKNENNDLANEVINQMAPSLSVLTGEADPVLVGTFIEEAEQVVRDINMHWCTWLSDQKDWQSFANMRRGFHTLKGSGRFVGAELLSEFAWEYENLCNKILGKKEVVSEGKQKLLQMGVDSVPDLVVQLKNPVSTQGLDVEELMGQVKNSAADAAESSAVSLQRANKEKSQEVLPKIEQKSAPDKKQEELQDEALQNELTGIFSAEATQHIKVMLDALGEEGTHLANIRIDDELLRTVHTMRGSARTAGVKRISDLCRPLEEIIAIAIKHKISFSAEQTQLVQSCVKQIKSDLSKVEKFETLDELDSGLIDQLEQLNDELHDEHSHSDAEVNRKTSSSMIDYSQDRDQELCEIFFEEAEDVLSACQGSLQKLKNNSDNDEAISELQRQFHTLKGSSRMAGFSTIGEISHVTESLLIALSEGSVDNGQSALMLQRVLDSLHADVELAQREQDIYLDDALIVQVQNASGMAVEVDLSEDKFEAQPKAKPEQPVDELISELQLDHDIGQIEDTAEQEERQSHDSDKSAEVTTSELGKTALKKFINVNTNVEENTQSQEKHEIVRVPADVLDVLVNDAGEVNIQRSRLDQVFNSFEASTSELEQTIGRLREQLRKLEMETEAQILFKHADDQENLPDFDPLELDRYSDIQQLSRSLAESVDDLTNIKEMFLNHMQDGEDVLVSQKVVTTNLQDNLLHTRMIRFDTVEPRLQRIVRQTSGELKKQVELVVQGGDIEVDRRVLNGVITSIEHILRNSVGHGIELPEIREKNKKSARGQIKIEIAREGSEISIAIKDDGAGIDSEKVKAKAIENGLITSQTKLTEEEILQLIFKSGLSTASSVSKIAGRGVGMDIVDKDIRRLGGNIETRSAVNKGAKFILRLPFTLAVSHALLIRAGKEVYALTLSGVEGVIQVPVSQLKEIFAYNEPAYTYAGHDYSFHHLASLLHGGALYYEDDNASYPVILVRLGEQRLALQVEATYGNKEIVVKPLASLFSQAQGISGATILGDGSVALILDIPWIARLIQTRTSEDAVVVSAPPVNDGDEELTVMVVDDSITIRKVTTRFLERNNYKVITAKDGVDALQKLQKNVPDVLLLDIEMPRMDGYELATQMRKDERLTNVPIIMITSRTGDKHRNRALELGVNSYLGKPYNEAQLLERIKEF